MRLDRKHFKRYTRFLMVGLLNAAVDLLVLNVLLLAFRPDDPIPLMLCNTIAVACAILNSYICNRHWTFAGQTDGSWREKMQFIAQAMVNIVINDVCLVILAKPFSDIEGLSPLAQGNLAKGVAMLLSSTASYWLLKGWVFSEAAKRKRSYS